MLRYLRVRLQCPDTEAVTNGDFCEVNADMPGVKKPIAQRPKISPRPASSPRAGSTLHKIKARNVAFGFAAINLMFVMVIILILQIFATSQIFSSFGERALVPAVIFNVGCIMVFLLLLWIIKGYTEARWYSIFVGIILQISLAIYLYPTSITFSLLLFIGVFATLMGAADRTLSRSENTTRPT
jgi:chromate transport protein ChrA